ncbi:peptide deformylase [bacterium]|nr:peptide deformylase [bacterium]
MILPIRAIGDPVLKTRAKDVTPDYEGLQQLIDNMFETMYNSNGIGLAAPQVGASIRLFILDTGVSLDDEDEDETEEKGFKDVFINPEIVHLYGDEVGFEEGCLSIPHIREEVFRPSGIEVHYLDRNFNKKSLKVGGLLARVFQHEFDHIEGILFTDLLSPLKRGMLKSKLEKIKKGKVKVDYPMRFPK